MFSMRRPVPRAARVRRVTAMPAARRNQSMQNEGSLGREVILHVGPTFCWLPATVLVHYFRFMQKRSQTYTPTTAEVAAQNSRNMLHASIGQSYPAQSIPSEKAHQLPSCTFSLPKSQQRNGTQLRIRPASRWQAQAGRSRLATFTRAESKSSATAPWVKADARLVLADGSVWRGRAFGATDTEIGEVVFNTSITGYEEIMTDPSYRGQFVVFTHPHIGNVGINIGKLPS